MPFDLLDAISRAEERESARLRRPPAPRQGVRKGLVVMSNGIGRDSATMTCLAVDGELVVGGEVLGASDLDVVVFSDPGYEWGFSHTALATMTEMLAPHDVPFYVLRKPPSEEWLAWHQANNRRWLDRFEEIQGLRTTAEWFDRIGEVEQATELREEATKLWDVLARGQRRDPPWLRAPWIEGASVQQKARRGAYHHRAPILESFRERHRVIIHRAKGGGRAECTVWHKIDPIRQFLSDLLIELHPDLADRYNVRKKFGGLHAWAAEVEIGRATPCQMLIGFHAEEKNRAERAERAVRQGRVPQYVRTAIVERYPLIEGDIGPRREAEILSRHGMNWVRKSGCMICPAQGPDWWWALSQVDRQTWEKVVDYERRAISRNPAFTILPGSARKGWTIVDEVRHWRENNPYKTVDEVLDDSYGGCGGY